MNFFQYPFWLVESLLAWTVCLCETGRQGSCVYGAAGLSSWWVSESNWSFRSSCIYSRDLPHLNQHNCSSTILPLFPTAWRQLGLCKGMVADLVLGIHRPNFLGDALLTSVFCYSHQGSILQCWKQKHILLSLSSGSRWHCAQQFLLTWIPTERHCLSFHVSKDSNNVIFLEGISNAYGMEIAWCSNIFTLKQQCDSAPSVQ